MGAGGNSCFGGRTTVGMIRLWRAVSSSVASSRVFNMDKLIGERDQEKVPAKILLINLSESLKPCAFKMRRVMGAVTHPTRVMPLNSYGATHPACGLKHFEVQRVSWQLAFYFGQRMAGGHTCHKMGFDKIFLVGSFLWQLKAGETGSGKGRHTWVNGRGRFPDANQKLPSWSHLNTVDSG